MKLSFRSNLLRSSWLWLLLLVSTALFGFSNAEATFLGLMVAGVVLPAWLGCWLIRLSVWGWRRQKQRNAPLAHPYFSWSIEPIVCAMLIGIISVNGLMWGRFVLSLPFLSAFAQNKVVALHVSGPQKSSGADQKDSVCGLYVIRSCETSDATDGSTQVLFLTAYETLTDAAGFAFVPSGGKPKAIATGQPCYFEHLFGPWWRWRLDV